MQHSWSRKIHSEWLDYWWLHLVKICFHDTIYFPIFFFDVVVVVRFIVVCRYVMYLCDRPLHLFPFLPLSSVLSLNSFSYQFSRKFLARLVWVFSFICVFLSAFFSFHCYCCLHFYLFSFHILTLSKLPDSFAIFVFVVAVVFRFLHRLAFSTSSL